MTRKQHLTSEEIVDMLYGNFREEDPEMREHLDSCTQCQQQISDLKVANQAFPVEDWQAQRHSFVQQLRTVITPVPLWERFREKVVAIAATLLANPLRQALTSACLILGLGGVPAFAFYSGNWRMEKILRPQIAEKEERATNLARQVDDLTAANAELKKLVESFSKQPVPEENTPTATTLTPPTPVPTPSPVGSTGAGTGPGSLPTPAPPAGAGVSPMPNPALPQDPGAVYAFQTEIRTGRARTYNFSFSRRERRPVLILLRLNDNESLVGKVFLTRDGGRQMTGRILPQPGKTVLVQFDARNLAAGWYTLTVDLNKRTRFRGTQTVTFWSRINIIRQ